MSWTFSIIKNGIRNLSKLQDEADYSDVKLNALVNRIYNWELPKEIRPLQLYTWYPLTISVGDDTYELKKSFYDTYIKLDPLAYLSATVNRKEHKLRVFYDVAEFYNLWPEGVDYTATANQARPTQVLIDNNALLFRKCPDDTYYVQMRAMRKPLVYVNGTATTTNDFVNDDDIPELEQWGQIIVYLSSIKLLEQMGNMQDLQLVSQLYENEIAQVSSLTANWYQATRATPKF